MITSLLMILFIFSSGMLVGVELLSSLKERADKEKLEFAIVLGAMLPLAIASIIAMIVTNF